MFKNNLFGKKVVEQTGQLPNTWPLWLNLWLWLATMYNWTKLLILPTINRLHLITCFYNFFCISAFDKMLTTVPLLTVHYLYTRPIILSSVFLVQIIVCFLYFIYLLMYGIYIFCFNPMILAFIHYKL